MGSLNVLNVSDGDTKFTFDKDNPVETIRASRIVKDMLRRGYALLVEVERDGKKAFERALDFREDTAEYIIADYDPQPMMKPAKAQEGDDDGESIEAAAPPADSGEEEAAPPRKQKGRRGRIPASSTRAVAVSRSAGG